MFGNAVIFCIFVIMLFTASSVVYIFQKIKTEQRAIDEYKSKDWRYDG
jgi:hypothetical protein